jgi:hypothetical protein
MSTQRMQIAALATIFTIEGLVLARAQSPQAKSDTYTWLMLRTVLPARRTQRTGS